MTKLETAKFIEEHNGSCDGIFCYDCIFRCCYNDHDSTGFPPNCSVITLERMQALKLLKTELLLELSE